MVTARARRLALVPLFVALATVVAAAALAAEPARVVFSGAEGCPSDTDLVVAVAARGRAIVSVANGGEDVLRVTLRRDPAGGYRGMLQRGGGKGAAERELTGATCREVVDGLAIVVASALGPDAPATPGPSATAAIVPSRPPEASPPVSALPTASAAASVPGPALPPSPSAAPAERDREVLSAPMTLDVPPGQPATLRQYRDWTIFGGVMSGPLPGTIVPRVDLEARRSAALDVTSRYTFVVGPVLRTRVGYFGGGTLRNALGEASVQGVSVGVAPCIDLRYRRSSASFFLCSEFAAGVVLTEIKPRGSTFTSSDTRSFSTLSVDGELVYPLASRFHLAAKAGLSAQLGRLVGERPDGVEVFRSPSVGFHTLLGVGTTF